MSAPEVAKPVARTPKPPMRAGAKKARRGERRVALYLIAPTIILLAIVIGYPVVSAIVMSFQKDAGLDPATGMFVQGGFAGFSNYTHWLLQQCSTADGGTTACP